MARPLSTSMIGFSPDPNCVPIDFFCRFLSYQASHFSISLVFCVSWFKFIPNAEMHGIWWIRECIWWSLRRIQSTEIACMEGYDILGAHLRYYQPISWYFVAWNCDAGTWTILWIEPNLSVMCDSVTFQVLKALGKYINFTTSICLQSTYLPLFNLNPCTTWLNYGRTTANWCGPYQDWSIFQRNSLWSISMWWLDLSLCLIMDFSWKYR